MNLFRKVGKKFEETKQAYLGEEGEKYVCRSCEESLTENHDYCPHCGEATVESVA